MNTTSFIALLLGTVGITVTLVYLSPFLALDATIIMTSALMKIGTVSTFIATKLRGRK